MNKIVKIIVSFLILLVLVPFTVVFCTIRGTVPSLLGPTNQYESTWISTDEKIEIVIRSKDQSFNDPNNPNFEDHHEGTVRITRNNGTIEEYAFIVDETYYRMYACIEGDPNHSTVNDQIFATHENILVWDANAYLSNKRFSAVIEESELEEFSVGEKIKFNRIKEGYVDDNYKQLASITLTVIIISASISFICIFIIVASTVSIIRNAIKKKEKQRD